MILKMTLSFIVSTVLTACATGPKCGNAADSQTVFTDAKTCSVRIRQVLVASKMNLPSAAKTSGFATWRFEWTESAFVSGRVSGGHFTLSPADNMVMP